MPRRTDILYVVRDLLDRLGGDASLQALSRRTGWSRFHLQRRFRGMLGESPKAFAQRVRLERAAARLAATDASVLDTALGAGFASHEVFIRAFHRQFGCTPRRYRAVARKAAPQAVWMRHATLTDAIAPCISLFRFSEQRSERKPMSELSIVRRELEPLAVLFVRRRFANHELQSTLAQCFGMAYGYAQQKALPIAGFPIARYISTGPGLWTVDAGVPLAAPCAGEGDLRADFLPGGPVAFAVHKGPYDQLGVTHAAIERWIEASGFKAGGPHWEWYVNDPGEHPNPADWKTEVYWPLAE